ncbi:ETC complex I subunit [Devosia epidermidihirudinis]|uniref:ETC complex I subunit n=1 Tax=Devosia epidermidihirudinis TaxID=1293439 RepID=A0A0F5QHT8_9HYPH|nr:ETC complex I subunit [Devosia epidermidihirudinis]KKC39569.1 ETC complex I subunit [Devosia epidermidihirudinis]
MTALIYRPARNAMQSGKGKSKQWLLVHEQATARTIDPLMGYTSSTDTRQQVKLSFDTLELAEAYAQKNGIAYSVQPAHEATPKRVSYPDNFRSDRKTPWTH